MGVLGEGTEGQVMEGGCLCGVRVVGGRVVMGKEGRKVWLMGWGWVREKAGGVHGFQGWHGAGGGGGALTPGSDACMLDAWQYV